MGLKALIARRRVAAVALILGDAAALSIAVGAGAASFPQLAAWFGEYSGALAQFAQFAWIISAAVLIYFALRGHYGHRTLWWQQVAEILKGSAASLCVSALLAYAWHSWGFLAASAVAWSLAPFLVAAGRWIVRAVLLRAGLWSVPTLVAGGAANAARTLDALRAESYLVHDITIHAQPDGVAPNDTYEYAIYCPDTGDTARDAFMIDCLSAHSLRFGYVPPIEASALYNSSIKRFFGHGLLALEPAARGLHVQRFVKEAVDRTGALVGIVLLSPVFLALALLIRRDGGPALFGHKRIGKGGRVFKCWKFRSMVPNAQDALRELLEKDASAREEYARDFKLKNDPRVTRIGALLRKTSLDEIPQLFNVLRGEMSLMGPRPIVEDEKKFYHDRIADYMSVKPGITGLWQVSGRSDTGYDQRVYLDSWYVRNWSFWNDVVIGFRTFLVVLARKGAY